MSSGTLSMAIYSVKRVKRLAQQKDKYYDIIICPVETSKLFF